jgi:hypothetical protein
MSTEISNTLARPRISTTSGNSRLAKPNQGGYIHKVVNALFRVVRPKIRSERANNRLCGERNMKKWILASAALLSLNVGVVRAQDNVLNPAEVAEGYKLLFDGTLQTFKNNWVDYIKGNATNTNTDAKFIADAACKCITMTNGQAADLRSTKIYKDFELRMNFRIDGNQGILYRTLLTTDRAWQTGVEYAINNVTNLGKDNPGAAYDIYAPNPITYQLFSTGKWNSARIVVVGDSVEHWMNDKKVVGYKYHSPTFWETYNVSKWNTEEQLTNLKAHDRSEYIKEGYLGLQGDHGGKWMIKDFKLTEKPCFGPLKPDGSVCASTVMVNDHKFVRQATFSALRQGSGNVAITFANDLVKSATIVGLDGKSISQGTLTEGGHKAIFGNVIKAGLYFLRLDLASGTVTQKLNLL